MTQDTNPGPAAVTSDEVLQILAVENAHLRVLAQKQAEELRYLRSLQPPEEG